LATSDRSARHPALTRKSTGCQAVHEANMRCHRALSSGICIVRDVTISVQQCYTATGGLKIEPWNAFACVSTN